MTKTSRYLIAAVAALSGLFTVNAAHAELIYGLNDSGTNIFSFDSTNVGKIQSGRFITGLASNEQMLTIDARPTTGAIYAVGSMGNLYTLNPNTGAAALVAPITGAVVNGTNFGSDFNPVSSGFSASGDTLRFSSDTGINYRINPATAAKGINVLIDEGLLEKRRGIGMFVATGARDRLLTARRKGFIDRYIEPLVAEASRLGIDVDELVALVQKSSVTKGGIKV